MHPYTSMIGHALTMIMHYRQNEEVKHLKELLQKIDKQFSKVHWEFKQLEKKFDELRVQVRLGAIEQKIRVAAYELSLIHKVSTEGVLNQAEVFVMIMKMIFKTAPRNYMMQLLTLITYSIRICLSMQFH